MKMFWHVCRGREKKSYDWCSGMRVVGRCFQTEEKEEEEVEGGGGGCGVCVGVRACVYMCVYVYRMYVCRGRIIFFSFLGWLVQ